MELFLEILTNISFPSDELIKNLRSSQDCISLKSIALTTDTSIITSIGNDYSFEDIFSRQLEALASDNDVLIGISTSGESQNILNAIEFATPSDQGRSYLTPDMVASYIDTMILRGGRDFSDSRAEGILTEKALTGFFNMYGTGSFADELVNNSVVVSCNNPHSFEVFDYFTYTPSENESIGEIEDAIADYCHQNADILYSNFTDYENTFFRYIANPEKLKQKKEVVVQCIVMESNIEYGFWIYTKKYDSIKEKLDRRSYQIRSLNLENETSINITNCPDEPIRGFTETQIEDDNYEFFDYKFEWINLDTDQKDESIIKVDFSDAAYTVSFEIDLNTFSKLDVDLSSWNITIPIIWEFIDEQQNNVGKVTIQYIKNGSTVADSVCEVELFNQ